MLISLLTTSFLTAAAVMTASAEAPLSQLPNCTAQTPSDEVCLLSATARGSGCKQDQAETSVQSLNGQAAVGVKFGGLFVRQYEDSSPRDRRRFCTLVMDIRIPKGLQIAAEQITYEGGFAYLEEGKKLRISSSTRFPGSAGNTSTKHLTGKYTGFFEKKVDPTPENTVWSPCGQKVPLNIKSTLMLSGAQSGAATVNKLKFKIKKREC